MTASSTELLFWGERRLLARVELALRDRTLEEWARSISTAEQAPPPVVWRTYSSSWLAGLGT